MTTTELIEILGYRHGIVAVTPDGEIIHGVLYPSKPTLNDFHSLNIDLMTDEELGLVGEAFELRDATPREVEEVHKFVRSSAFN